MIVKLPAGYVLALSVCGVLLLGCSSSDSAAGSGASANGGSAGSASVGGASPSGGRAGATSTGGAPAAGSSAGGASAAGASPGGDSEPPDETGMTAAHNAARAAVMPAASPAIPPLVWSATVAQSAQAWADQCNFMHSGNPYGENIYAGAGSNATPQMVVDDWVGEAKDYDYAANTCSSSGVCGHYTQVVWRKSTKLGCGMTHCTKNSPFPGFAAWQLWVCEYDPPGNFNGEKPY